MSLIPIASLANGTVYTTVPFVGPQNPTGAEFLTPAAGQQVHIYAHGTTTPATVYTDEAGLSPASQPLVSGADGGVPGFVDPATLPLDLVVNGQTYELAGASGSGGSGAVASVNSKTGAVVLTASDVGADAFGAATAAQAASLQKTQNLLDLGSAATARTNLGLGSAAVANVDATAADFQSDGTPAAGTTGKVADAGHVHPTDATRAPLASPAFTGTPTAPTPATTDSSTKIATTAHVQANTVSSPGNHVVQGQLQQVANDPGRVSKRITANAVSAINAPTALTISTPDASGQVVEPAVTYIPGGWNGHKWWALITGYTAQNNQTENPSLYYSDDGQTFTAVTTATVNGTAGSNIFPIVAALGAGNYHDDPEILLGPDGKLHLFWVDTFTSGQNTAYIMWCTYDGTNLTTPAAIIGPLTRTTEAPIAPVVYWDGANNQWVLLYTDIVNVINSVNAANPYRKRTCPGTQPNGTWSAPTLCTVSGLPASQTLWESHIEWYGDQLHMVSTVVPFLNNGTQTNLYFGVSNDGGNTWTMNSTPLLAASAAGNWDSSTIYRGDIVPIADPTSDAIYGLYYSAGNASNQWHMGYTTIKLVQPTAAGGSVNSGGVPLNSIATMCAARTNPIAPYVLGDSCIRANSTTSPGTADSGQAWTVDAGTFGILSNQIYSPALANTKAHIALTGLANGFFSAEFAAIDTVNAAQALLFRYQDASNFLSFTYHSGVYTYQTVVAGVTTNYALANAPAPQAGDILAVKANGQTLSFYVNGNLIAQFANQANFTAVSAIGLQIASTNTTPAFRNITARSLVAGL